MAIPDMNAPNFYLSDILKLDLNTFSGSGTDTIDVQSALPHHLAQKYY